jgi:hypothetical protein
VKCPIRARSQVGGCIDKFEIGCLEFVLFKRRSLVSEALIVQVVKNVWGFIPSTWARNAQPSEVPAQRDGPQKAPTG